jgi:hypothetical protein
LQGKKRKNSSESLTQIFTFWLVECALSVEKLTIRSTCRSLKQLGCYSILNN